MDEVFSCCLNETDLWLHQVEADWAVLSQRVCWVVCKCWCFGNKTSLQRSCYLISARNVIRSHYANWVCGAGVTNTLCLHLKEAMYDILGGHVAHKNICRCSPAIYIELRLEKPARGS